MTGNILSLTAARILISMRKHPLTPLCDEFGEVGLRGISHGVAPFPLHAARDAIVELMNARQIVVSKAVPELQHYQYILNPDAPAQAAQAAQAPADAGQAEDPARTRARSELATLAAKMPIMPASHFPDPVPDLSFAQREMILNMQRGAGPALLYASGLQLRDVGQLIDAGLIEIDPETKDARLTPAGKAYAPEPLTAVMDRISLEALGKWSPQFDPAVMAAQALTERLQAQVAQWRSDGDAQQREADDESTHPEDVPALTARAELLWACADDLERVLKGGEA